MAGEVPTPTERVAGWPRRTLFHWIVGKLAMGELPSLRSAALYSRLAARPSWG